MVIDKKRTIVAIVIILIISVISLYGIQHVLTLISENSSITVSDTSQTIKQIQSQMSKISATMQSQANSITESLKPKPAATQEELYQFALEVVNDDRASKGISPVSLGDTHSAQNHADDLLTFQYFSHWNTNGIKPYATYTLLGGRGDVNENISYVESHCLSGNCFSNSFDPFKQIKDSEYEMMYDDASSNWGHRDNILDPNHTDVNFGIAFNNNRFYFVEHFENNIIKWQTTKLDGNKLHLAGLMPSSYSISQIDVYSDPSQKTLTADDLDHNAPYNLRYYDSGKLVGIMVPRLSDGYYRECTPGKIQTQNENEQKCLDYVVFDNTSRVTNGLDLTVNISKWMSSDLHTIYIQLKKPNGEEVSASSITLEFLK